MPRQPTGRPPGRPKTKEYVTVLARIPSDLAEQVKRYAGRHRCSVAELIRDGLVWRIEQDTPGRPWSQVAPLDTEDPPMPYNGDTGIHELSPMLHAAIQDAVRETLQMVLAGPHGEHEERVIQQPIPVLQQDTGESQPDHADAFDHTRYRLGALCKRGHDWHGTGKTLRYLKDNYCWQCGVERKRAVRRTIAAREG